MNRGSTMHIEQANTPERGFNEAPIHESGKFRQGARGRGPRGEASMRPRFMNRGSD